MKLDELKEKGRYVSGAMEYVREGNKKIPRTIKGVEIWKCDDKSYWVENVEIKVLGTDDARPRQKNYPHLDRVSFTTKEIISMVDDLIGIDNYNYRTELNEILQKMMESKYP